MKKRISALLAFITVCTLCLAVLTSCGGDSKYEDLIKENAPDDVFYVAVREDLTVVSNLYDGFSLTELGLGKDSYLIWGDADHMYFGSKRASGAYTDVVEYSFDTNSLNTIKTFNDSKLVFSPDGTRFYSAYVKNKGVLGYNKYFRCIDLWERETDLHSTVHEEEVSSYPSLNKDNNFIRDYIASVGEYGWVGHFPGTTVLGGRVEDYLYFADKSGNEYQPHKMQWTDPVWDYINEKDPTGFKPILFDTYGGGRVMIGYSYKYSSGLFSSTTSTAYFEYTFGSKLRFITEDSNSRNPIMAIYTFN